MHGPAGREERTGGRERGRRTTVRSRLRGAERKDVVAKCETGRQRLGQTCTSRKTKGKIGVSEKKNC
jgi:hypothetical protein